MQSRREGWVAPDAKTTLEDDLSNASDEYKAWRAEKIATYLADNVDTNATDHSTIMTNDLHARLALTYDVAMGLCQITAKEMRVLREAADWRYLQESSPPFQQFFEHFDSGYMKKMSVHSWVQSADSGATMPEAITDRRENPALSKRPDEGSQQ